MVSAEFRDVVQGNLIKGAQTFEIDLAFALNECRTQLFFTSDMAQYVADHLTAEVPAAEPAAEPAEVPAEVPAKQKANLLGVQGGRLRCVGGRFYR